MDKFKKLSLLSENMDVDEGEGCNFLHSKQPELKKDPLITYAKLPNGRDFPLLKSMITSVCEKNCRYCAFRSGRDFRRVSFKPEEMAKTFMELHEKQIASGLFLSSGIAGGGIHVQDKIVDTAAILREKIGFKGYLHLKIMPGAEFDQVFQLMKYASRISINLEAPTEGRLEKLAPKKNFYHELLDRLYWANKIRETNPYLQTWNGKLPSISTQFVVGPSGESDFELLNTSTYLFNKYKLARVYFMTFNPVINTPLENDLPENPVRGHRLYQSSYLIRDYGFTLNDFEFGDNGNLELSRDPKTVWAEKNLTTKPLEINRASKEELLRVPGIGPKRVTQIINFRRRNLIKSEGDLKSLGVSIPKSGKYLLLNGKIPQHQLTLFPV